MKKVPSNKFHQFSRNVIKVNRICMINGQFGLPKCGNRFFAQNLFIKDTEICAQILIFQQKKYEDSNSPLFVIQFRKTSSQKTVLDVM